MHTALRPGHRRAIRAAPVVLAVALLAGVAVMVTGAKPASAWTISTSSDEVVITSDRLHDITVRATLTIRLRRNGDVLASVDAHNSGATRKYFMASITYNSGNAPVPQSFNWNCVRIASGTYGTWRQSRNDPTLAARFDDVLNDPNPDAHFHLDAVRTANYGCPD